MSIKYELSETVVKQDLARLPQKMLDYAFEVLLERAHLMVGLAQVGCPVDTGSLRDSIRVERGGEGESWRRVRVRAGGYVTNPKTGMLVNYAAFVEAKYPFMHPAWEQVKGEITGMIRAKVVEGLTK